MKRRLDITIVATQLKLENEEILATLQEMVEEGTQQGIIDKGNNQFYHLTEDEHSNLIMLLSKQQILIDDFAKEMELPSKAIEDWLNTLVKSGQLQGTFNATRDSFVPSSVISTQVRDSFIRSGKLGVTEAAGALGLDIKNLRRLVQTLIDSGDLEGYYTLDNEYFITTRRLEEDITDFLGEEKQFPIKTLTSKLNLNVSEIINFMNRLTQQGKINGVISEAGIFTTDELLDQSLVNAVKPFSRISITELAAKFGFNERSMKDLVVRAISKGLIVGTIDSISNEFVKERVAEPTAPTQVPQAAELISVKRDYDYLGGDIHFKVALQNITKTAVSKISVLLNVPDQFHIDKNVEKVEILNPNETRGVDFIFTPLACGQGQIFGTVSYTDAFGEPHSVTIRPKEVWVKCPLVKAEEASTTQADQWKRELQKSTTTIDGSGISAPESFKIACEQIAALDLAEVTRDEVNLRATFSGIAKVTGERLIVEITISREVIILDVYTGDQKQATGLLAYMRNLIKMSLDVSRKLLVKSEKLGAKVLTAFQIAEGLFKLCDYCEIRSPICDFLLLLKEVLFKIHKEFTEIKFSPEAAEWLEELSNLNENELIPTNYANGLEYSALIWLKEVESLAENTAAIYLDSFDTRSDERDKKIGGGLIGISTDIIKREQNYSLRVAHYVLIIHKVSGLCLYNFKFSPGEIDPDLMSGFLQAIQSFGTEFSTSEEAGMKRLSYKDFEIFLEESELIRVALVGIGKITDFLEDRLKEFVKLFTQQFQAELIDFRGNVGIFYPAGEIIKKIFQ